MLAPAETVFLKLRSITINIPYNDTTRVKHHAMIDSTDRFISITDIPAYDKTYFVAVSSNRMNNGRVLWFRGFGDNRENADSLLDRIFGVDSTNHELLSWASLVIL